MQKPIKIDFNIEGVEDTLSFNATIKDHENFINDVESNNKTVPMKRFLKNTVVTEDKDKLQGYLDKGYTADLFGQVTKELIPKIEFSVKK